MYINGIAGYLSRFEGTEVDAAVERTQTLDAEFAEKVDKTTEVNGHALTGDITITAEDTGALPDTTPYGASLSWNNGILSLLGPTGIPISSQYVTSEAQWGHIAGILSDQEDLVAALAEKYDASNPDGFITGITSTDVTTALGYTPYNGSTNPNGYITGISGTDVTTALGYTPYNAANPAGYITGINSADVTTALGYTPYNATNPAGYITGITSTDVTTALGYTPYNATNPNGYISSASLNSLTDTSLSSVTGGQFLEYDGTSSKWKNKSLASTDVTTALGFTPYNATNPDGFISGIDSTDVTTALGFTPYDSTNPDGFISGIDSTDVTTALGFTPYNATNPSGYISSASLSTLTDTSLSSITGGQFLEYDSTSSKWKNKSLASTDVTTALGYTPYDSTNPSGYITSASLPTIDQTYSGTSTNAQSGVAIQGELTTNYQAKITSSAMLSSDLVDDTNKTHKFATAAQLSQITTNQNNINTINGKIPAEATSTNQLADKAFVNSSIASNTANFIGTFSSVAELEAYTGTVTNNDYAFVTNSVVTNNGSDWTTFSALDAYNKSLLTNLDYAWVVNGTKFDLYRFDIVEQQWDLRVSNTDKADVALNTAYNRYKATVSGSTVTWAYEYTLNNSSFTSTQWAAINSGINDTLVAQITTNQTDITGLDSIISGYGDIVTHDVSEFATSAQGGLADTALQPNDNITELVNNAGYITGIDDSDVITALGYTPYNATNPNGYISSASLSTLTDTSLSSITGGQFLEYDSTSSKWKNKSLASTDVTTALGYTPYDSTNPSGYITGISSLDVTTALGYTPYNATNPSGYISSASLSTLTDTSLSSITGGQFLEYDSTSSKWKNKSLASTDVTTALGFTPYDSTNPSGYITGISSTDVTTALGYTPYDSTNPSGYITGITSGDVTTALGYTPYDSTNPSGYITGITSSDVITALGYTPYSSANPSGYISSASMSSLTDTSLSSLSGGQFLKYDSTAAKWKNVSLAGTDVTTALGYTPYDSTNPSGYISSASLSTLTDTSLSSITGGQFLEYNSTSSKWENKSLASTDVTTALGFTPYDATNPDGYITGIDSTDVTTALGYTPYDSTNPDGYITGIDDDDVINALGYTPYSSANPSGYISSAAMSTLTDVALDSVSGGQILVYDGTASKWKNQNAPATAVWGNITGTLSNQTDLQTALNGKQTTITGAASTVVSNNLTTGRVVISNSSGKIAVSSITDTKLGYLTDVTSNIQSQINGKQDTISGLDTIISGAAAGATALQPNDNITQLTNNAGYITSASLDSLTDTSLSSITGGQFLEYNSTSSKWENKSLASTDVTTALGFTPYNSTNPSGYISSAAMSTLTDVALDSVTGGQYLVYDGTASKWKNTDALTAAAWGNITGTLADQTDLQTALNGKQATISGAASTITTSDLTASRALISNADGKVAVSSISATKLGYLTDVTSNIQSQINGKQATLVSGTNIKSINNTTLLGSGNIDVLANTSTDGFQVGGGTGSAGSGSTAIGINSNASNTNSTALGYGASVTSNGEIAIGNGAAASDGIQIGAGTNSTGGLQVWTYQLLDDSTGLIPDARLSSNIARTSNIGNGTITFTQGGTTVGTITMNQSGNDTIALSAGTTVTIRDWSVS